MMRRTLLFLVVLLAGCGDDDAAETTTTVEATTTTVASGDAAVLLAIEAEFPDALEAMGRSEWLDGIDAVCDVVGPMDDAAVASFVDAFYTSPILNVPGMDSGDQLRAVIAGAQVRCPAVGDRLAAAAGV